MNKTVTLLFFVFAILFIIYMNKPSGHNQELQELDKKYKHTIDSVTTILIDSIHKREIFYLKEYSLVVNKLDKMEGERNHYRKIYNEEVNNRRSFSDHTTDSLLSEIR